MNPDRLSRRRRGQHDRNRDSEKFIRERNFAPPPRDQRPNRPDHAQHDRQITNQPQQTIPKRNRTPRVRKNRQRDRQQKPRTHIVHRRAHQRRRAQGGLLQPPLFQYFRQHWKRRNAHRDSQEHHKRN